MKIQLIINAQGKGC